MWFDVCFSWCVARHSVIDDVLAVASVVILCCVASAQCGSPPSSVSAGEAVLGRCPSDKALTPRGEVKECEPKAVTIKTFPRGG